MSIRTKKDLFTSIVCVFIGLLLIACMFCNIYSSKHYFSAVPDYYYQNGYEMLLGYIVYLNGFLLLESSTSGVMASKYAESLPSIFPFFHIQLLVGICAVIIGIIALRKPKEKLIKFCNNFSAFALIFLVLYYIIGIIIASYIREAWYNETSVTIYNGSILPLLLFFIGAVVLMVSKIIDDDVPLSYSRLFKNLKKCKQLFDNGILTEEEYLDKRNKIFESYKDKIPLKYVNAVYQKLIKAKLISPDEAPQKNEI